MNETRKPSRRPARKPAKSSGAKPVRAAGRKTAATKSSAKSTSRANEKGRKAPVAKTTSSASRRPAALPPALRVVEAALADMKAVDVRVLDVRGMSDVADFMVVASGTSDRHLRSIADRVVQMAKAAGQRPLGVEGEQQGEWVLVDLPDVMVHVMLPRTREFYQLEHLWESPRAAARPATAAEGKRATNARA